jgi:hypothetical protein
MDCLSSEDLKEEKAYSLCIAAYTEPWCCQVARGLDKLTRIHPIQRTYSSGSVLSRDPPGSRFLPVPLPLRGDCF